MWKPKKDEDTPRPAQNPAPVTPVAAPPRQDFRPVETKMPENIRTATAHIGKSVVIKGQLSGSEDLYVDGEVEGTIELPGHTLTVGPSARVRANVSARIVVVQGNITGNVRGSDKVELKNSASLSGDIVTKRIAIDDGAFFKGGIDIQKEAESKATVAPSAASTTSNASASAGSPAPSTGASAGSSSGTPSPKTEQPSLIPTK